MTLPSDPIKDIKDPFDLLGTESKIIPVLPKTKLDTMIAKAMTHEQISCPVKKSPNVISKTGWWSGGLATAACLILLITLFPQNTPQPITMADPVKKEMTATDTTIEISEILFYDTLESF